MSHKADIDLAFDALAKKEYIGKGEILYCKFEVYEALEWDDSAREVVEEMLSLGYDELVDGNMRCYLDT